MIQKLFFTTITLLLLGTSAKADNNSSENRNNKYEKKHNSLEFRDCSSRKPLHDENNDYPLTGEIGNGVLSLDFSEFEGTAQVKCKDLVTGDQCTYSTTANGTSYQYIGDVSGVLQITVTTAESSYECITVVE